jgi:hypothetical protein
MRRYQCLQKGTEPQFAIVGMFVVVMKVEIDGQTYCPGLDRHLLLLESAES